MSPHQTTLWWHTHVNINQRLMYLCVCVFVYLCHVQGLRYLCTKSWVCCWHGDGCSGVRLLPWQRSTLRRGSRANAVHFVLSFVCCIFPAAPLPRPRENGGFKKKNLNLFSFLCFLMFSFFVYTLSTQRYVPFCVRVNMNNALTVLLTIQSFYSFPFTTNRTNRFPSGYWLHVIYIHIWPHSSNHAKRDVLKITVCVCVFFRGTEEVFQTLEDNQVTLSTIKASRFVRAFEKEMDRWERSLSLILEVIEMILTVQRQWMYLEVDTQKQTHHQPTTIFYSGNRSFSFLFLFSFFFSWQ